MKDFEKLYFCTFEPSAHDQRLHDIATEYHKVCEEYNKTVCSGKSKHDDCSMPVNCQELRLVNWNANMVMSRLINQNQGIEPKEIQKAISHHITYGRS
jgi:hypothetical protein